MTRLYGWKRDLPDKRDRYHIPRWDVSTPLPDELDLRTVDMPNVWDQGSLGACTAFAGGAAASYELHNGGIFVPSFLQVYYCEREREGTVMLDAGAYIRDVAKVLAQNGAAPADSWPYRPERFAQKPPKAALRKALDVRVSNYARVPQGLTAFRRTLAGGDTIVFGFSVYESFESESIAETGMATMPKPHEQLLGGHAVLMVGYSQQLQAVLCRNSWGSAWGYEGYFWLPYEYVLDPDLAADFWTLKAFTLPT